VFFTQNCIKIFFFYFLKIFFNISILKWLKNVKNINFKFKKFKNLTERYFNLGVTLIHDFSVPSSSPHNGPVLKSRSLVFSSNLISIFSPPFRWSKDGLSSSYHNVTLSTQRPVWGFCSPRHATWHVLRAHDQGDVTPLLP
jgi:hypothetical protein